mmetsp:Transcript_5580/g.8313  ORF Transcript_5580/g.8313 Transcript_5580/m.8313 type:complete len:92 (+) Transcript_5580:58-333(+)
MSTIDEILADDGKLNAVTKAVFDQVDADGSGQIDKAELKAAMNQVAQEAEIEAPSEEDVEKALKELDTDMSGTIDVNEFKELVKQLLQALK